MKYLKLFEDFLLEKFDLSQMYQKEHIIKNIQDKSEEIVNDFWENTKNRKGEFQIPVDIKHKKDNIIFWVSKQIKNLVLSSLERELNPLWIKYKNDEFVNTRFYQLNIIFNYLKGKDYEKFLEKSNFKTDEDIENAINMILKPIIDNTKFKFTEIFDYILSPVRNININSINLVNSSFQDLLNKSEEWHKELKASGLILKEDGFILKEYPDGFYWIDLQTNQCREEGDAMGHCARTNADTLLSLRERTIKGIQPHVTVAIDYENDEEPDWNELEKNNELPKYSKIHQMKGKGNKKPIDRYHKYIVDLLCDENLDIYELDMDEYSPQDDFHIFDVKDDNLIDKMFEEKPSLFRKVPMCIYPDKIDMFLKYYPEKKNSKLISDVNILWNKKIITDQEAETRLKDLKIKNNQWYIKLKGDLYDLDFMFNDDNSINRNYSTSRKFVNDLKNDDGDLYDLDFSFNDLTLYKLTKQTIEKIINKLDFNLITDNEIEELGNPNNPEFDFNDLKNDILNNDDNYLSKFKILLQLDIFEDIKQEIIFGFEDAQNSADEFEKFNAFYKPLKEFFGIPRDKNFEYEDNHYLLPYNIEWGIYFDKYSPETISAMYEYTPLFISLEFLFDEEQDKEVYFLTIDMPYNGFIGIPSKEDINSIVSNRI